MGACYISMNLPGNFTKQQVLEAFRHRQAEDRAINGHRDGYSGDFQTVHTVKFHDSEPFEDAHAAYEYCLDHAEKWEYVIAIKVKNEKTDHWLVAGWGAS